MQTAVQLPNIKFGYSFNKIKTKEKEKGKIMLDCSNKQFFNGIRFRWYTGFEVRADEWNNTKGEFKKGPNFPNGTNNNVQLTRFETVFLEALNKFKKSTTIIDDIKQELNREKIYFQTGKKPEAPIDTNQPQGDLLNLYEEYIEERKKENYVKGSIDVYVNAYKKFKAFCEDTKVRYTVYSFDVAAFERYKTYLYDIRFLGKRHSANHLNKMTANLKLFIKRLEKSHRFPTFDLSSKLDVIKKEEVDDIALDLEDLKKLYAVSLSKELSKTRDLFLIGCYTGLRYCDLARVAKLFGDWLKIHDGHKVFEVLTQKTNKKVVIPAHEDVIKIMENNEMSIKAITNQKMNENLKTICEKAGLDEIIEKREKENNVHVFKKYRKFELVTTHTARRTFVTLMYNCGVPAKDIQMITGHKSEKEFNKYLKIKPLETAIKVVNLDGFKKGMSIIDKQAATVNSDEALKG